MKNFHVQTMQFTHFTVELNPWNPLVCLHHTLAVRNFIEVWRVLTWQHCQNQITASDFYKLYKTRLTCSPFSATLLFTFCSLSSGALWLSSSRCSSLNIRPFTWAFLCPLLGSSGCFPAHFFHFVSRFFTFFRLARTYYFFSPFPAYFHSNLFITNLNENDFLW